MNTMVDVHCHILPGLDDGPASLDEAVEMCALAWIDGIKTIVATPHMLNGIYQVQPEQILTAVQQLNCACRNKGLDLTVLPGADVYIDKDLPQLLQDQQLMTVANRGRHLMVELPEETVPEQLASLLFELQLMGVTPVISHPERNFAIQQDIGLLHRLVEAGNLTQITAGALTGQFGSSVQKCSLDIGKAGLAHLLASDAHDPIRRKPQLSQARRVLEQILTSEEAEQMTCTRPRLMTQGKYVPVPEAQSVTKKGFFSFLSSAGG